FRSAAEVTVEKKTVREALDRIGNDREAHDATDVRVVGDADPDEIEMILRESRGSDFRRRVRALLGLGNERGARAAERAVAKRTGDVLRKEAAGAAALALRLGQYIESESSIGSTVDQSESGPGAATH